MGGDVQLASPNGDVKAQGSLNPTPSPPQMIVKKRAWLDEGKKQETILASVCNHFRKDLATVLREAKAALKTANKQRKLGISAGQSAKEKAEKKEKREREKAEKKERKREKKEKKRREKEKRRKAKEAAEAAQASNPDFDAANNITNYFSHAVKNMPAGTKNAFEVLGKKKKEKTPKKHKSKKEKYKTKLVITFDEEGNFRVPIKISKGKLVKNLGVICAEPAYHGTNTIYPVGYKCCIAGLPSFKRPGSTTIFTTEVLRGESGPVFSVTCSDDPEFVMTAKNPSKVWGELKVKWQEQKDAKEGKAKPETPKKGKASGPQKIG